MQTYTLLEKCQSAEMSASHSSPSVDSSTDVPTLPMSALKIVPHLFCNLQCHTCGWGLRDDITWAGRANAMAYVLCNSAKPHDTQYYTMYTLTIK